MFPNAVMEDQETWNDVLGAMIMVRDAQAVREWRTGGTDRWQRNHSTSAWSATASWAGRTPTPIARSATSSTSSTSRCSRPSAARNANDVKALRRPLGLRVDRDRLASSSSRDDIDAIDICVPNDLHAEIAIAAAQGRQDGACEKPLGRTAEEGEKMVEAVEKAGVPNMVWYNYRRVPAVTLIKQIVDEGQLGRIFHYRAQFLQDWTISPDVPQGGAGTLAARRRASPAAASPAICSPTASTPRSGSTARSPTSPR